MTLSPGSASNPASSLPWFFSECCFGTSMQMIKVHLPLALQRVAGYFCWPICDLRPIFKIKPTEFILLSQF